MNELKPDKLNPIDIEILKYISQFEPVSETKIMEKFRKYDNVEYLIGVLASYKQKTTSAGNHTYITQRGSSYIIKVEDSTDDYRTTEFGKRELQNYLYKEKQEKKLLWLTNAKIPILISVVTYLILRVLEELLRLILE